MNIKQALLKLLHEENKDHVKAYGSYILKGQANPKTPWFKNHTPEQYAEFFIKVKNEGLVFDGIHVTLQSTGITYDFVAYKNKMLHVYPETEIDLAVVLDGDTFQISKANGKVEYSHKIANAFNTPTIENITGAYCVIKNQRGEFETLLSKEELAKHKSKARTKNIWNEWYKEMCLKTVIKKATKYHFEDVFESMNNEDNKSIDIEAPTEEKTNKIEKTIKELKKFKDVKKMRVYFAALEPKIKNDKKVLDTATDHADELKKKNVEKIKNDAKKKAEKKPAPLKETKNKKADENN